MSTETKCLTFLEILRLKNSELWESKLNHFSLLDRGDLQLLYSHSLDQVLLKFHNYTWVLDKDLQIIGTRSIRGEWQAYSIVSPGGFLCLKITGLNFMNQQHPELVNFEAIIESRSNFLRNTSLEKRFDLFKEGQKSGLGNVTDSIMNVVHSITGSLTHSDYTNHPNYLIVRPINDLLSVESTGVPVVDIPEKDLNNYRLETTMLHDYQVLGEWKELWEAGNNEYLLGFSKMSLSDFQPQGQQLFESQGIRQPQDQSQEQSQGQTEFLKQKEFQEQGLKQGYIGGPQAENLRGQSGFQQEGLERIKSQQIGDLGYQEAAPGQHHYDGQEVLGGEQQRLPSYEVDKPKEHVTEGFEAASSNIQEGVPKADEAEREDTEFTTGLLKDDIEPPVQESPKTPYHVNEMQNPPQELKALPGVAEKIDLPKDSLNLQSWGSNVTNASETTPTLESDLKSDFRSADNRTNMDKINSEGENIRDAAAP